MTIEEQIAELAEKAAPLRALDEDDPAKIPLGAIVDEINALRAEQERQSRAMVMEAVGMVLPASVEGQDAEQESTPVAKRGPGRPRKTEAA